ncbi:DedA family protein [Buchnera aphidicola]|uniref:DedA family protein n=1 Tax=Buchnera aphidicola TaxID=9 RepID=UPI003463ABAE
MDSWLTSLVTYSFTCSLFIVGLVSFLESLALVGLLLPGVVFMTTLGTLIGDAKLSFYPAWMAGTVGCLLGDWVSYYLGLYFKDWLHNLKFLKKHQILLDKTKHILSKHSLITILIGRFVGPTRPLIPMVAGMLKLPLKKFISPNIIGCILWPPIYFFPGIVTGIAINIPDNPQNDYFKWFLLIISLTIWLGIWLTSKWWKASKDNTTSFFTKKKLGWISIIILSFGLTSLIAMQFHPAMFVFKDLFMRILKL